MDAAGLAARDGGLPDQARRGTPAHHDSWRRFGARHAGSPDLDATRRVGGGTVAALWRYTQRMEFTFENGPPAWIEWEGVRWYRRSKSGHYADRTGVLLHVAVWERVSGHRLPRGHVVHHRDTDVTNNYPSNLELLTRGEHIRHHNLEEPRGVAALSPAERSDKARKSWAGRPAREHSCVQCGAPYTSTGQRPMYCSPKCRMAAFKARRAERGTAPLAAKPCEWCGTSFLPGDPRTMYCGQRCRDAASGAAKVARNRARLGKPGCLECGGEFTPKDARQVFCSGTCRDRYRRNESRARWAG
jgi:hypothetical protein